MSGFEMGLVHEEGDRSRLDNDPNHRRSWLPKWEFPMFDGDEVRVWLDNCEAYFQLYQIPEEFRVNAASLHLRGIGTRLFGILWGFLGWFQFKMTILNEFDLSTHSDKILELLTLKQTGSVLEYKIQFEKLVYHLKLFDKAISETFLVTQFVLGLKQELRVGVEVQFPKTVSVAAQLVQKHESWQGRQSPVIKKTAVVRPVPSVVGKENSES